MKRILIVEDSAVVTVLLKAMLELEDDLTVVGSAPDGCRALELVEQLKPDLITMDIHMPGMDGLETTREIMQRFPTPIIVISSAVREPEMRVTFRALEEGAVAVLEKPAGLGSPDFEAIRQELVNTIRVMAGMKMVRRRPRQGAPVAKPADAEVSPPSVSGARAVEVLGVGSSTGGPQALCDMLGPMSADFPVPILIAQHISLGFVGGMIAWLQDLTALRLKLAVHDEPLLPGTVYFAPDDYHLRVSRRAGQLVARLDQSDAVNLFRPSATPLLESIAAVSGPKGAGLILTGMGEDGARGLLALYRSGGCTMAQEPNTCVVAGMPQSAIALGAVNKVVRLQEVDGLVRKMSTPQPTICARNGV